MKKNRYPVPGFDCASCASKAEERISKLPEVESCTLDFAQEALFLNTIEEPNIDLLEKINEIIEEVEPGVHLEYEKIVKSRYQLTGLDCDSCAAKVEEKIRELEEIESVTVDFATETLHITTLGKPKRRLLEKINEIAEKVETGAHLVLEKEKQVEEKSDKWIPLLEFILPILLYVVSFAISNVTVKNIVLLIAYIGAGWKVLYTAFRNILRGQIFDENFLMAIATLGALALGDVAEAVSVMIFYSVGEFFQSLAVDKSRTAIADLMDIVPEIAHLEKDGEFIEVAPDELEIGDFLVIKPGEKIPVDGEIIEGHSSLDTRALTGESMPVEVGKGSKVLSGAVNLDASIRMEVLEKFEDSTVSRILELVEESGANKAPKELTITRFARFYTPIVVGLAFLLAVVPPLVTGSNFSPWIYRALVFLVASCPCALLVSIPLGIFAGIGKAGREGILIKGGDFLEAFEDIDHMVFDKTGTLTKGNFKVSEIVPVEPFDKDMVLKAGMIAESLSKHPIAESIKKAYPGELITAESVEDFSGEGILARFEGAEILAGNEKLMNRFNIHSLDPQGVGTIVHIAVDEKYAGYILITDEIKEEAKEAISILREQGVQRFTMLTGDNKAVAKAVAKELGLDEYYSNLLPHEKVEKMEEFLEESHGEVAFVGDGINDAPVLTLSDIGIAMGNVGSDAAIEAADVVIMEDHLVKIPETLAISKRTMRILNQNIIFALSFKALVLTMGALGMASMWIAVFADTGVALLAILNSIRVFYTKK